MRQNVEKLNLWLSWSDTLGWTLLDLWRSFEAMSDFQKTISISQGSKATPPIYCDWFVTHLTVGIRRMIDLSDRPKQNPSITQILREMQELTPPISYEDYLSFLGSLEIDADDSWAPELDTSYEKELKDEWFSISDSNGRMSSAVIQPLEARLEYFTQRVRSFTNNEIAHHGTTKQPPTAEQLFSALVELDAIYCRMCLFLNPSIGLTQMRMFSQFRASSIMPFPGIMAIEDRATRRRTAFWQSLEAKQEDLKKVVDWKAFEASFEQNQDSE